MVFDVLARHTIFSRLQIYMIMIHESIGVYSLCKRSIFHAWQILFGALFAIYFLGGRADTSRSNWHKYWRKALTFCVCINWRIVQGKSVLFMNFTLPRYVYARKANFRHIQVFRLWYSWSGQSSSIRVRTVLALIELCEWQNAGCRLF